MPQRDSVSFTFTVAVILCVVCSLAVSSAAVVLRPLQTANEKLDEQRNILDATGLAAEELGRPAATLSRSEVDELFERITTRGVDLETGEYVELEPGYDPRKAAREPNQRVEINTQDFRPGPRHREPMTSVHFVHHPGTGEIEQVVLPVYGNGLWSTMYGYLALDSDLQTVRGLTFYEHGETPGLGGEVDNPRWKAQWPGVQAFDPRGRPALGTAKGTAPADDPHLVDGLSGATITARGVTETVRYWLSDDAFGPFLERLREEIDAGGGAATNPSNADTTEATDGQT